MEDLPDTGGRRIWSQLEDLTHHLPPVISLNGAQLHGVEDDPLTLFTWEDEGRRRRRRSVEEEQSKVRVGVRSHPLLPAL